MRWNFQDYYTLTVFLLGALILRQQKIETALIQLFCCVLVNAVVFDNVNDYFMVENKRKVQNYNVLFI